MAWDALAFAASVAYQSGEPDGVEAVRETLVLLEVAAQSSPDGAQPSEVVALRLWVRASTGPHQDRAELLARLGPGRTGTLGEHYLSRAGAAAWVLDESERAVGLLQAGRNQLREPTVRAASGGSLSPLGWACLDAGRWDDALDAAAEPHDVATGHQLDIVSPSADLIVGTILAARGEGEAGGRASPGHWSAIRNRAGRSQLGPGIPSAWRRWPTATVRTRLSRWWFLCPVGRWQLGHVW